MTGRRQPGGPEVDPLCPSQSRCGASCTKLGTPMKYSRGLLFQSRRTVWWLAALCAWGLAVLSAAAQGPAGGSPSPNVAVPSAMHGVIQLDGPWRFQMGDDPRWADASLDD